MLYYKEKNGGIKMAYQIYCGKGFDTQKAERFFKERRVAYQRVDVLKYGIGRRELESVAAAVGLDALCDKESKAYRESVIAYTQNRDSILAGLMEKTAAPSAAHRPRRPPRHRRILPGNLGRMAEGLIHGRFLPAGVENARALARQQQRAHAPCVRL